MTCKRMGKCIAQREDKENIGLFSSSNCRKYFESPQSSTVKTGKRIYKLYKNTKMTIKCNLNLPIV